MNILLTGLALSLVFNQGLKEKVTFESDDGVIITADHYQIDNEYPYIVLFHQAGSSRGEFNEIAEKLMKLRYNCLAVDLRSGDNSNFIRNETAISARKLSRQARFLDARQDIHAAIDFAYGLNPKEVILFGSSYSASLVMLEGEQNSKVNAVIAFSPGEYFMPDLSIRDTISGLSKPVFIASSEQEAPYIEELASGISADQLTIFKPELGTGIRGSAALGSRNENNSEYWLALLLFATLLFAYELLDLWAVPRWTAWLIVFYFSAALVVDSFFRGAAFCKSLRPLGHFNFVASLVSPFEVKARSHGLCRECGTKDCIKGRSERKPDPETPAMVLGLMDRPLTWPEVLGRRLFPSRIEVPEGWMKVYRREWITKAIGTNRPHDLVNAF